MNIYDLIAKFKYLNNDYVMFNNEAGENAFLRVNEKGSYVYPTIEELAALVKLFDTTNDTFTCFDELNDNNQINVINVNKPRTEVRQSNRSVRRRRKRRKKYRFIPKVKINRKGAVVTVALTASILAAVYGLANVDLSSKFLSPAPSSTGFDIGERHHDTDASYEFSKNQNNDVLYEEEDASIMNDSKYAKLYSNKYYDDYFNDANTTLDTVLATINSNPTFDDRFRNVATKFITGMVDYYGDDLELRLFNENLKTLDLHYATDDEIALVGTALAKYNYEENRIYINQNIDYTDEYNQIIMFHELGHAMNSYHRVNEQGWEVKVLFCPEGTGKSILEPLDVILTTQPFEHEYTEESRKNMGYGVITNITRIIVDSTDYEVAQSTQEGIKGVKRSLENALSDNMTADEFLGVLDLIFRQCQAPALETDPEYLNLFYTELTNMYLNKFATPEMTSEDIIELKDDMIARLERGHVKFMVIDYDAISNTVDEYMVNNNISHGKGL